MKTKIHPTAVIEQGAQIDENVTVGPYCVIREKVSIGSGTCIDSHTVIEGKTRIGRNNVIGIGAVIGNPPQDLKYRGEETEVIIGDKNIIREYVTINRGTVDRGKTEIGNNSLLMSYVHVAHDCIIGNEVILANCATLGGHIKIDDQALVGGVTPIHQFVHIGKLAIIGGGSRVPKDIPPFCRAAGNPIKICGLNSIGLKRRNYSSDDKLQLKRAYKKLYYSGLNTKQAIEEIEKDNQFTSEPIKIFIDFIKNSTRGICKN
ncbi:MAG: acyl-ACP--UDP-N-acetylglucosamine O-acyltransferase [Elusimicrobiota bacterium]